MPRSDHTTLLFFLSHQPLLLVSSPFFLRGEVNQILPFTHMHSFSSSFDQWIDISRKSQAWPFQVWPPQLVTQLLSCSWNRCMWVLDFISCMSLSAAAPLLVLRHFRDLYSMGSAQAGFAGCILGLPTFIEVIFMYLLTFIDL